MLTRPLEDCISDSTDVVINYMCDTRFHREVMGLSSELSGKLANVSVREIRASVASVYGTSQTEAYSDHEERVRAMAYRLRDSMRAFRAIEGMPQPEDDETELDDCKAAVSSVFRSCIRKPSGEPIPWFKL